MPVKFGKILIIALLLLIQSGNLFAADEEILTTLKLALNRNTNYTLVSGDNSGELILTLSNYPANALDQLEGQFNQNFMAMKVMERGDKQLKLVLIILPIKFNFKHVRKLKPHSLEIEIIAPKKIKVNFSIPDIPPVPFWEMLSVGSIILPDVDYTKIKGRGAVYQAFMSVVRLYEIGAYEAALRGLRKNLSLNAEEFWAENLMLMADVLFHKAVLENQNIAEARKALVVAEQEASDPLWKSRALLLLGYASYIGELNNDAIKSFTLGIRAYPDLEQYFLVGYMQVAIKENNLKLAADLIKRIEKIKTRDELVDRQICFAKVVIKINSGEVASANRQVAVCQESDSQSSPLGVGELLVLAETRLLSNRFGEAKQVLESITRDYPDHVMAPMAGMRSANILCYEKRYEECNKAYKDVLRRFSGSKYSRLSNLYRIELERQRTGNNQVMAVYDQLDLHHEPEPLGREIRLRILWNYEAKEDYQNAYLYLTELFRRYQGERYWPFAGLRFTKIILNAYKQLEENDENLDIINMYQAETPFPLTHDVKDQIAMMVTDAFGKVGRFDGSIKVFLDALNRDNRPIKGERELLLGLTDAYLALNDLYRARKTQDYFRSKFKNPKDSRDYFFMIGEIEQRRGKIDNALVAFQKAMSMVKTSSEKRTLGLKIGRVLYYQNKFGNAVQAFEPALSFVLDKNYFVDPQTMSMQVVDSIYFWADSYYNLGQWEDATKIYRRSIKMFPKDERSKLALYYMAECMLKLGKIEKAEDIYAEMITSPDRFWQEFGTLRSDIAKWQFKHNLSDM